MAVPLLEVSVMSLATAHTRSGGASMAIDVCHCNGVSMGVFPAHLNTFPAGIFPLIFSSSSGVTRAIPFFAQ